MKDPRGWLERQSRTSRKPYLLTHPNGEQAAVLALFEHVIAGPGAWCVNGWRLGKLKHERGFQYRMMTWDEWAAWENEPTQLDREFDAIAI